MNESEKLAISSEASSGKLKKLCYSNRYLAFVNEAVQPGNHKTLADSHIKDFVPSLSDISSAADCIATKTQVCAGSAARRGMDPKVYPDITCTFKCVDIAGDGCTTQERCRGGHTTSSRR
jgi:hypothetical protein